MIDGKGEASDNANDESGEDEQEEGEAYYDEMDYGDELNDNEEAGYKREKMEEARALKR